MADPWNLAASRTRRKPSVHGVERIAVIVIPCPRRRLGGIFVICVFGRGHIFGARGEIEIEFARGHEGWLVEDRLGGSWRLRKEEGLGVGFAQGRHGFLFGGVEGTMGAFLY